MSIVEFVHIHLSELGMRSLEHLLLCIATISFACLIAVPAGILLTRFRTLGAVAMSFASIVQTVPSLALLGLLMVITNRIGYAPSLIALFLYSLLPILQNTHSGIQQTPQSIRDAAMALGMSPQQVLWQVSLPLALPVIVAGIRTSTVLVIGTATLCAFIGAGGLGVFINRGIETINPRLVLLGVIPVSCMALIADWLIARLAKVLSPAAPGGDI